METEETKSTSDIQLTDNSKTTEDGSTPKENEAKEDPFRAPQSVDQGISGDGMSFKKPFMLSGGVKKPQKTNVLDSENKDSREAKSSVKETEKAKDKNNSKEVSKHDKPQAKSAPSKSKLSPAEQKRQSEIPIPYKEPSWGGLPAEKYEFEVLKNGIIIENIDLSSKSFHVIGRLPSCDVPMEHPSLSRYHAVMQYRCQSSDQHKQGWYLYDLDSTHGTWVNKYKVKPKTYYRVHVGHVLKFGGSSRLNILQGPPEDEEEESELSVTELKEQRQKQEKELELIRQQQLEDVEEKKRQLEKMEADRGCSWGIDEAEYEEESEENPFATEDTIEMKDEYYTEDPKKALKGFFEREGYDLPEYIFVEGGKGKHTCKVELPLDSPTGQPIFAEATVSGKRKDAVVACALEACRVLDRHGVLRASTHESKKRKSKNWEEDDYYDSDEDTFLDRTGTIEQKRKMRMARAGKKEDEKETYETLVEKLKTCEEEREEIEEKLAKAKQEEADRESEEVDALDAYMSAIKSGAMDTKTKMKLKRRLLELKLEEAKLRKLANIAKPANLPELKPPLPKPKPIITLESKTVPKASMPIVGKMKGTIKVKKPDQKLPSKPVAMENESDNEEEEEDEEENGQKVDDDYAKVQETEISLTEKPVVTQEQQSSETSECKNENMEDTSQTMAQECDDGIREETAKPEAPPSNKRPAQKQEKKDAKRSKPTDPFWSKNYADNDPDYAVWVPPEGQSGDGKTKLNEKYGY